MQFLDDGEHLLNYLQYFECGAAEDFYSNGEAFLQKYSIRGQDFSLHGRVKVEDNRAG